MTKTCLNSDEADDQNIDYLDDYDDESFDDDEVNNKEANINSDDDYDATDSNDDNLHRKTLIGQDARGLLTQSVGPVNHKDAEIKCTFKVVATLSKKEGNVRVKMVFWQHIPGCNGIRSFKKFSAKELAQRFLEHDPSKSYSRVTAADIIGFTSAYFGTVVTPYTANRA